MRWTGAKRPAWHPTDGEGSMQNGIQEWYFAERPWVSGSRERNVGLLGRVLQRSDEAGKQVDGRPTKRIIAIQLRISSSLWIFAL